MQYGKLIILNPDGYDNDTVRAAVAFILGSLDATDEDLDIDAIIAGAPIKLSPHDASRKPLRWRMYDGRDPEVMEDLNTERRDDD